MNDFAALLELKKKAQKQLRKTSEKTSVNSERAKALLLLAEGATQEEAAEQTSLSLGQIRYWLGRFRTNGIACFPEVNNAESVAVTGKKASNAKKAKKTDKKAQAKNKDSKSTKTDKTKKKDKSKKIKKTKTKK